MNCDIFRTLLKMFLSRFFVAFFVPRFRFISSTSVLSILSTKFSGVFVETSPTGIDFSTIVCSTFFVGILLSISSVSRRTPFELSPRFPNDKNLTSPIENISFVNAVFLSAITTATATFDSHFCTCLGHLGRHNSTNRNEPTCVVLPKVAVKIYSYKNSKDIFCSIKRASLERLSL
jgi:hypothetical protein